MPDLNMPITKITVNNRRLTCFRLSVKAVLVSIILVNALSCWASDQKMATAESEKIILSQSLGWSSWSQWLDPVWRGQYPVVGDPSVILDKNLLRMYYTCFDPDKQSPTLCLAISGDGFNWDHVDTGAVEEGWLRGRVIETRIGTWEDTHETPEIIKWKGKYLLYFSGYVQRGNLLENFPAHLGLARSTDGIHFTRYSDKPILRTTSGWYDHDAIFSPSVIEHDGKLFMVYAGHCWTKCDSDPGVFILGASSSDGITWEKQKSPLIEKSMMPPWFEQWAGEPELIKGTDGYFYLFFTAVGEEKPYALGVARSVSPFGPWQINPEPIVVTTPDHFAETEVVAPSVLIDGDKVRMWFSGFSNDNHIAIGYAEAAWPLFTYND